MEYRVIVKNYMNVEVYNETIWGECENDAIIQVLQREVICEGDTITIEAV